MTSVRVALVTGANQGIGFGIVRKLCKEHPDWVIYGTSRSEENGKEAEKKLKEEGLSATYLKADLTDEQSFRAVKEKLVAEHGGLDVLVNNAGIAFKVASTDPYPHKVQVTFATNVFGTDMVCQQLFPILRNGARVVVVGSSMALSTLHKIQTLCPQRYEEYIKSDPPMSPEEVLQSMRDFEQAVSNGDFAEKGWPDNSSYSMSKLASILLTRAYNHEFSKTPERDIVVNDADPGYVSTNMSSYTGKLTVDEGADTPYYAATLPSKTDVKGQHLANREIVPWK